MVLIEWPFLFKMTYLEFEDVVNKYIRKDDWFMWVNMAKGGVNFPIFQSLEAFWPGVLVKKS